MHEPSGEERAKESSFLYSTLADVGNVSQFVVVAILSGSLTIFSEAVRGALMIVISFYSLWLLRAVHRGNLTRYQFGVGKIEQAVWVLVGFGLVVSGLWIAQSVIDTVFSTRPAAGPLGLVLAAISNAVNSLINFVGWYAMVSASGDRDSAVYRAQLRARTTMMVSSFFLQVTLTIAALARDDAIALVLDAVGATFVSGLMVYYGVWMISRSLPHLLDAPAPAKVGAAIREAVEREVPAGHIVAIRTRRAGSMTFAEVAVAASAFASVAALRDGAAVIADALRREGEEVDLSIVVAPWNGSGRGGETADGGAGIS